ncbi:TadE-like protein [Eubacterium uniforme]|uniref:TadE-like protein n=1 Tax=Eubacterium uniforme TaxID=39495 RepID=A0A1T4VMI5_9FIRM|nr:TadE family protein [Eubacterium uniforme]SKA66147.1 TadE-like protein [Eubacterium uniforme]
MLLDAVSPIKRLKGEEGQDIVEFALVLPILAALLFGIIDYGWIFLNSARVANAAREGARFAVMNYKQADADRGAQSIEDYLGKQVEDNVRDVLPANLKNSFAGLQVKVTETNISADDHKIEVEVSANIKLFTPVVSTIIGSKKYPVRKKFAMKKMN